MTYRNLILLIYCGLMLYTWIRILNRLLIWTILEIHRLIISNIVSESILYYLRFEAVIETQICTEIYLMCSGGITKSKRQVLTMRSTIGSWHDIMCEFI